MVSNPHTTCISFSFILTSSLASLLSLMQFLPVAKIPPPVHSGPVPTAHLWCVAALADGRQERGNITGMGFEMVRSSVYSAAQMKVSREEMHKVVGGGRWVYGRGREERVSFCCQWLTYTSATLSPKDSFSLFVCFLFFISLSLLLLQSRTKHMNHGSHWVKSKRNKMHENPKRSILRAQKYSFHIFYLDHYA